MNNNTKREAARLGGPAPAIGTVLVKGFRCYGTLRRATVVAVHDAPDEWAALCKSDRGGFEAVDHLAMHVGLWRSADRAGEHPSKSDAAQARARAAWGG